MHSASTLRQSQPSTTACRSIQVRVRVLTTWAMRTSTQFTYHVMPKFQTRQSVYRNINVPSLTEVCSPVSKFAFWQSSYDPAHRQIIFYRFYRFFPNKFSDIAFNSNIINSHLQAERVYLVLKHDSFYVHVTVHR